MRRAAAWLGLLGVLVAPAGAGETTIGSALGTAWRELRREGVLPTEPGDRATAPTGFPPGGDPPQPLASPGQDFTLLHAGSVSRVGNRLFVEGGLAYRYRGFDGSADAGEANLDSEVFALRGDVSLIGRDRRIAARQVTFDHRNRLFTLADGFAALGPAFIGGNLRSELFVRGAFAEGSASRVVGRACSLTTCDRDDPHFHFDAERIEVLPGRRATLRGVSLTILGQRVLRLPGIVLPLREYPERYTPEVGSSPDEGYYVKTKLTQPLAGDNYALARLDYFTKLGAGLGGDWGYVGQGVTGLLALYGLTGGSKTRRAGWRHEQQLFGGPLSVQSDYQRDDYLTAPGSAVWSTRAGYSVPKTGGSTRLTYFRNSNESGSFQTALDSVSVADRRTVFGALSTAMTVAYGSQRSAFSDSVTVRRQADVSLLAKQELGPTTAELEYQRLIPVGEVRDFFSSSDRTPMFTLRSSASRLLGPNAARSLPWNADLSIGELVDPRRRERLTRTGFDFRFDTPDRRSPLRYGGRFRQTLYSDATAQYVLGFDAGYRLPVAGGALSLRYGYLRPHGFTPLQIDETGKNHDASLDLTIRPLSSLTLAAQTGYDFLEQVRRPSPWRSVSLRSEFAPSERLRFRALTTYDTARAVWNNVRMDLGWNVLGGRFAAGARFDGVRHTWGAVNIFADGIEWGRLRSSVLLNYNGYTKRFEARHFSFTYDMHCAEVILQVIDNPVGFRSGTEVSLFLRIKALPFDTPFGTGRRGQGFGSGSGGFGF